jgi:hypothetical protein
MINKAARNRLFSFIRMVRDMDLQDIPDNLSERFSAVIVYIMALQDSGLVSPAVYNRIMTVAVNVHGKKNRDFYADFIGKENLN